MNAAHMRGPNPTFGIWQSLATPMMSRYLVTAGWKWIILDLQHGNLTWQTAYECLHAVRSCGGIPFIRTSVANPSEVQKALDMGASGVVVPMVSSLEEARLLAAYAKYPPLGERSVGGDPHVFWGPDYVEHANHETLLLVQIEDARGLAQVESIMAVPGIDGCFVGPTDLALSMGMPRLGYEHLPAHQAAMKRIVSATLTAGKLPCVNTYSGPDFQNRLREGYRGLTLKSDLDLLMASASQLRSNLQTWASEVSKSS